MPKRILLVGVGPLPDANAERLYAPALRLWAMMHTLLRAGHQVMVAEARFGEEAAASAPAPGTPTSESVAAPNSETGDDSSVPPSSPLSPSSASSFSRHRVARIDVRRLQAHIPLHPDGAAQALRELAGDFRPDALVTTTDVMALAAVRSELPQPLLVDYFGEPMAERQMQGAIHDSDAALLDAWMFLLPALLRADRFTVCSKPQRHALLGQLGAVGRLNRHTCPHNLVDVMPQGLSYETHIEPTGTFELRGQIVPREAVVVLFMGGYNTWLDERALFAALEEAMALDPSIHYVSTGGGIPGHNTVTFDRFLSLVENSRFKNRFHFLGWIPSYQVGDVVDQADIAINFDRWTHEAEFGLRNRLYLWMLRGTAVVTTTLSEEIERFAERNLVRGIPCGDSHKAAAAILDLARNPEARAMLVERAREFIVAEYGFERLMRPLRAWCDSPSLAPDRLAVLGESVRCDPRAHKGESAPPPPIHADNPLIHAQSRFLDMESAFASEREARIEAERRVAELQQSGIRKLFGSVFKK